MYDTWIMMASLDAGSRSQQISYSYEASSSTEGKIMLANRECHFAGVDSVLSPSQSAQMPQAWILPILGAAVAIIFNLPDFASQELVIPQESLAAIFLGRLRLWSDLSEWNPGLTGAHETIGVVVRSDFSPTSDTLTSALSSFSSEWNGKVGTRSKPDWPAHATRVKGSKGMALAIRRRAYSLGYLDFAEVGTFQVRSAQITNAAGEPVAPSAPGVQAAMEAFIPAFKEMGLQGNRMLVRRITDPKNTSETWVPRAYPISALAYLAFDSGRLDCRLIHDVLYLLYWAWRDEIAARVAITHGLSPVSWGLVKEFLPLLKNGTGLACGGSLHSPMEQLILEFGEKCLLGTSYVVHSSSVPLP